MHNDFRWNRICKPEIIGSGQTVDKHTYLISSRNGINNLPWVGRIIFLRQAVEEGLVVETTIDPS